MIGATSSSDAPKTSSACPLSRAMIRNGAAAGRLEPPLLIRTAVADPLDRRCARVGRCAVHVEALAAVARHELEVLRRVGVVARRMRKITPPSAGPPIRSRAVESTVVRLYQLLEFGLAPSVNVKSCRVVNATSDIHHEHRALAVRAAVRVSCRRDGRRCPESHPRSGSRHRLPESHATW